MKYSSHNLLRFCQVSCWISHSCYACDLDCYEYLPYTLCKAEVKQRCCARDKGSVASLIPSFAAKVEFLAD